jgi:hypothetical protein
MTKELTFNFEQNMRKIFMNESFIEKYFQDIHNAMINNPNDVSDYLG